MTGAAIGGAAARSQDSRDAQLCVAGAALVADPGGVLYWPEHRLLVVADLHLEKGSSFARRGMLLPPYDSAATLGRLAGLIARYVPVLVIALGDSFHDGKGAERLAAADHAALAALQCGRDWLWITGNHDPAPLAGIAGDFAAELGIGPLCFRHQPAAEDGVVAGHLHPVARVLTRARSIRRRCFVGDGRRLVIPAFGAFAGGLNVRDGAFAGLFNAGWTAHLVGDGRLYAFAAIDCLPD